MIVSSTKQLGRMGIYCTQIKRKVSESKKGYVFDFIRRTDAPLSRAEKDNAIEALNEMIRFLKK